MGCKLFKYYIVISFDYHIYKKQNRAYYKIMCRGRDFHELQNLVLTKSTKNPFSVSPIAGC